MIFDSCRRRLSLRQVGVVVAFNVEVSALFFFQIEAFHLQTLNDQTFVGESRKVFPIHNDAATRPS